MTLYNYAFAPGWNVPDINLVNPETLNTFRVKGRSMPPSSAPPDFFPTRRIALNGRVFGSGRLDTVWTWSVLEPSAIAYLISTFSLASAPAAPITIRTRLHESGTYARYNAFIIRPQPGLDYEYRQGKYLNVQLRLRGLVEI